jgi:DNA-binding NtrC family response regulator
MTRNDALDLLVIERQPSSWRSRSVEALKASGHHVTVKDHYDFLPYNSVSDHTRKAEHFDLVILGCAKVCQEELELVKRLLMHGQRVLVLSTSLPWDTMRLVFLAGAEDAAMKPYDPQRLVQLVEEAIQKSQPRDSYEEAQLARTGM